MRGYIKVKGYSEDWLVRESDNCAIAYTDRDEVRLTPNYLDSDWDAVNEFADEYDMEVWA